MVPSKKLLQPARWDGENVRAGNVYWEKWLKPKQVQSLEGFWNKDPYQEPEKIIEMQNFRPGASVTQKRTTKSSVLIPKEKPYL